MPVAAADPVAGKMENERLSGLCDLAGAGSHDPSLMEKPVAREEKEKAAPTTAKKKKVLPREEKIGPGRGAGKEAGTSPVTDTPAENKTKQVSADTETTSVLQPAFPKPGGRRREAG